MSDFMSNLSDLKKKLNIAEEEEGDLNSRNVEGGGMIPFSKEWKRKSTEAVLKVKITCVQYKE